MMEAKKSKVSVIIPVYNEEKTVVSLLGKVSSAELDAGKEIIIVNDGSTDSTPELIRDWINSSGHGSHILYLEKQNGGKGSAVRCGIENSTGDVVIIQDADLEYNPEDIRQCIGPILEGKEKIVYGSRELLKVGRHYSYLSYFLGGCLVTNWINFLFGSVLTDEPTCYKAFDGDLIRTILFKGNAFDWEPEITCKLLRLGYNIKEVGISYAPRNKEEGKKIKPKDGFAALWIALLWRFMPVTKEKSRLLSLDSEICHLKSQRLYSRLILLIIFLAFGIRVLVSLPSLDDPMNKLFRPDSSGYVYPALALVKTGHYNESPDTDTPAVYRVPGYSVYLAAIIKATGSIKWAVITSSLLSALTCFFVYLCGKLFGGSVAGLIAALLFCFNITSIAVSPLLLSDTLFVFFVSVQMLYFFKFAFSGRSLFFLLAIFLASLSALIRPVNYLWIAPAVFVILIYTGITLKKRIILSLLGLALFFTTLSPWMLRNYLCEGGFRLCNDYGNLLYANGTVFLGKINNRSSTDNLEMLKNEVENVFKKFPSLYDTVKKRTDYEFSLLKKMISEHPVRYFSLYFRPWILLPDVASFCEDLGFTQSGQGTFAVLNEKGVLAAALHYFNGRIHLLLLCLPLLLIAALTYCCSFAELIRWIFTGKWLLVFMFLACVEYYLFLSGPLTMPRYQLPALIMLCAMAGRFMSGFGWRNRSKQN